MHYGGAWHVSLTKGFRCVDLRKFLIPTASACGSLQRPASPYVSTSGQRSSRLSTNYTATTRQPDRRKLHTLLPQPGPCHSRAHRDMSRVQTVSVDHRVTVYPTDDYNRKSHWMYIARRQRQFRLRIQQTELILAPILDDVHRLTIRMSR